MKNSLLRNTVLLFITTSILITAQSANATWSILAVDRHTGEIGIAGASCTFDVSGIASVIPNKGAIVVQAASNYFARMKGVELMRNDMSIEDIMSAMKADNFSPERQQYAVVSLQEKQLPLVYSGKEITGWSGAKVADDFTVIGNILVAENVLTSAFHAFEKNRENNLAQRLMAALKAGAKAGGDKRCGEQKARSAFLSLYSPSTDSISTLSQYGTDLGGKPAVDLLKHKFDKLYVAQNAKSH